MSGNGLKSTQDQLMTIPQTIGDKMRERKEKLATTPFTVPAKRRDIALSFQFPISIKTISTMCVCVGVCVFLTYSCLLV